MMLAHPASTLDLYFRPHISNFLRVDVQRFRGLWSLILQRQKSGKLEPELSRLQIFMRCQSCDSNLRDRDLHRTRLIANFAEATRASVITGLHRFCTLSHLMS